MLVPLLLATSMLDLGRGHTLADIEAGYAKVVSAWDADHDGQLSQRELREMIDASWPRGRASNPDSKQEKRTLFQDFRAQDVNHDGYLTLDEILRLPRAEFACTDRDHNNFASSKEVLAALISQDCELGSTRKVKR